jgi:hypothetical protein
MPNGEFQKILVEAVDESLSSLGESPKQSILFHLENTFKIKKQEIPDKIASFDVALQKIFGPGANFLEMLIVKKLSEKTDLDVRGLAPKEAGFAETVAAMKKLMEQ